ncbi:MAG TPA: hypothetical protein VKW78_06860 [Terriglobales bacterium]|nr:hypothetical protein [Terriglobales bacterium]
MLNPAQHLPDMAEVQKFYTAILEETLGHPIPLPAGLNPVTGIPASPEVLAQWLSVLDLAVGPLMVRDALKESTGSQSAEALLRYFIFKQPTNDIDRDKTDFICTFLHRLRNVPVRLLDQYSGDEPTPFEPTLMTILRLKEPPSLPQEHRQLTREFRFIREELEEVRDFNQLMDSGLMQRSRDIKHRFGASFYHPHVLATVAEYNVCMSERFDSLFREAAHNIKEFAEKVQKAGGSIMSRVEGDVTVKQMTEVEPTAILSTDYVRSGDQLRRVSKLQKVVDNKARSLAAPATAAASASGAPSNIRTTATAPGLARIPMPTTAEAKGVDRASEDSRIRSSIDSIQNFITAAEATSSCVFPMRQGSLALTSTEVDAFRAEYRDEKSFRGEYACSVVDAVAVGVRILEELEDFLSHRDSAYLWKSHADSLTYLLSCATRIRGKGTDLLRLAEQRGLTEKAAALHLTLERLRSQELSAAKALETVESQSR